MSKVLRILGAATFTLLILGAPVLAFYLVTVGEVYWCILPLIACVAEFVILSIHWCQMAELDDMTADDAKEHEIITKLQEENDEEENL